MDDKQIINVLLTKIQKLNQEILQHEINNAAKDLEISGAKERIAELEKTDDFTIKEEETN
ncbi:hypothetical protein N8Y98_02710 [Pelagibacterales bacterium]|jgi:hypothetical protein|nr:hypothetical protein [Pelagibacterales bacterium]